MRTRTAAAVVTTGMLLGGSGVAASAASGPTTTGAGERPARSTDVGPLPELAQLRAALARESRLTEQRARSSAPTPGAKGRPSLPVSAAELQAAVDALVAQGAIGVTARVQTTKGTWAGAAGTRRLGGGPAARVDDRFRAASNTKSMVATLVMQEVERGRISLRTTVNRVVPGLLPGHDDVTIEQLLSHTSGLQTGTDVSVLRRMGDDTSGEAFIRAIGAHYTDRGLVRDAVAAGWSFPPGTSWQYSNAGYVALGIVLERVTGQDVGRLLERRVFARAGMRHSSFATKPGVNGPFLREALNAEGRWWGLDGFNPDLFSSAGAVVSTAKDLNRFDAALFGGRLVSRATVANMTTPRAGEGPGAYGLGLYSVPDLCAPASTPRYLWGHDGASYGTLSLRLSSLDGTRQVSIGVTGRYLDAAPDGSQPYDLTSAFVTLLRASC